ncbi:hypothetical protein [Spirosoma aerophilum]
MDELDKNLPDDFWRKTFEEASEMPPQRVWASIEQRLDESDSPKILPLWGTGLASSRPLRWGIGLAAAMALLLVGWWITTGDADAPSIAQGPQATQTQPMADTHPVDKPTTQQPLPSTGVVEPAPGDAVALTTSPQKKAMLPMKPSQQMLKPADQNATKSLNPIDLMDSQTAMNQLALSQSAASSRSSASFASASPTSAKATFLADGPAFRQIDEANGQLAYTLLSGKPLRLRRPGTIQRIVWARPAELDQQPENTKSKRQSREMWASVSMMPTSFNPSVSLRSAQPAVMANTITSLVAGTKQASVNSQANFSVAYQASAGVQLSERWSIESGVGYLSGRSTVEAPGYATASISGQMDFLTNRNSSATNAYVDALRNSMHSRNLANSVPQMSYANVSAGSNQLATYDNQPTQAISNNFQFVQVPVQVGYQLRPRKKLSVAVLGGLLANVFVRNTVGESLVVTSKDGVYRPVALAATMGARLRYRPTRQWSASLAGVYQPALESGTQADTQVQSRPTSTGMSVGVDYHF